MHSAMCFIITPIGPDHSDIRRRSDFLLAELYGPAAEVCGLKAHRADQTAKPGHITSRMVEDLLKSSMAIADLTGHNANVFYELGVRHSSGLPCVTVIEQGYDIPFDNAGFQAIRLPPIGIPKDGPCEVRNLPAVRAQLITAIRAAREHPDRDDSPVSVSMGYPVQLLSKRLGVIRGFSELQEEVASRLWGFRGDVYISNVDLNTIRDASLWRDLCDNRRVRKIRMYLQPVTFRRLERRFRDTEGVSSRFNRPDGLCPVEIGPVRIPAEAERFGCVLFDAAADSPVPSFVLVFPKARPFAKYVPPDDPVTAFREEGHWSYSIFGSVVDPDAVAAVRESLAPLTSRPLFRAEEIERFARGDGLPLDAAITELKLSSSQRDDCMRSIGAYPTRPKPDKCNNGYLETHEVGRRGKGRYAVLGVVGKTGPRFTLRRHHAAGESKPALLWVPPWGVDEWHAVTRHIDEALESSYSIYHLSYSEPPGHYSFSAARSNIRDALALLRERNRTPAPNDGGVVVAAVSVNAFLAATVAAEDPERIRGLALLAPAVDLFDSIDSFGAIESNVEMMSRFAYHNKQPCRPVDLTSIQYFGRAITVAHLVDLRVLGAARCGREAFLEAVNRLLLTGAFIILGNSNRDRMTSEDAIASLDRLHRLIDRVPIQWRHEIEPNLSRFIYETPAPDFGLGRTVELLRERAASK